MIIKTHKFIHNGRMQEYVPVETARDLEKSISSSAHWIEEATAALEGYAATTPYPDIAVVAALASLAKAQAQTNVTIRATKKEMTPEQKKWIDEASYEQLLTKWRFGVSDPMFQGLCGNHFDEVMKQRRREVGSKEAVQTSKRIGWEKP
jgi:hypothetical protein